ncbi:MAG: hypothetical protein JW874_10255 [Spirochaetales bacterium]|nr:hypothetical protein [Spirochaetales bacterium]
MSTSRVGKINFVAKKSRPVEGQDLCAYAVHRLCLDLYRPLCPDGKIRDRPDHRHPETRLND